MTTPLLELVDVTKAYAGPPRVEALRNANLAVSCGEMVAVVGPSGAGKSTLLNIAGLLDEPTSGSVRMNGTATDTMGERHRTVLRAHVIGFVFQAFHLVPHLDCLHNVMLPLAHQRWPRRQRREQASAALAQVGLSPRQAATPAMLSGGEQQRVAIARAIVHEPQLVLCDEPTGNLDSENTNHVMRLLRELVTPSRAVVVVTHDDRVRERADRTLVVLDGRIV